MNITFIFALECVWTLKLKQAQRAGARRWPRKCGQPRSWPEYILLLHPGDLVLHLLVNRISFEDRRRFTPSANQTPSVRRRAGLFGRDFSAEITRRLRRLKWREAWLWVGPCTPAPRRERCWRRGTPPAPPTLTLMCVICFTRMHRWDHFLNSYLFIYLFYFKTRNVLFIYFLLHA